MKIVYTCLFTITGAEPSNNKYIEMLYIWLHMIKTYGGLTSDDHIFIFIDEVSLDWIFKHYPYLKVLIHTLDYPCSFVQVSQPTTYFEGMILKYIQFEGPWSEKFIAASHCFYLDLDVLAISQFERYVNEFDMVHPDTLYLCIEGFLSDNNYLGSLATPLETKIINNLDVKLFGVTAGLFGFNPGPSIIAFIKHMLFTLQTATNKTLYTLDQPYFNREIIRALTTDRLCISYKTFTDHVYVNKHISKSGKFNIPGDSYILWNNMGEPMVQDVHMSKLIMAMSIMHRKEVLSTDTSSTDTSSTDTSSTDTSSTDTSSTDTSSTDTSSTDISSTDASVDCASSTDASTNATIDASSTYASSTVVQSDATLDTTCKIKSE